MGSSAVEEGQFIAYSGRMEPELKKTKEEWPRDLNAAIGHGLADADAGRLVPAEVVFAELRAKYQRIVDEQNQSKSNS